MRARWIGWGAAGLLATASWADVLRVPGEYPTIQAAIDASFHGDEIWISSGTYSEVLDFQGLAITLRCDPDACDSWPVLDFDPGGPPAGLRFVNGEGPGTVLRNISIRMPRSGSGAVVEFDRSSPVFDECSFFGATPDDTPIVLSYSHPRFQNCVFWDRLLLLMMRSTATFEDCPRIETVRLDDDGGSFVSLDGCSIQGGSGSFPEGSGIAARDLNGDGDAVLPAIRATDCTWIGTNIRGSVSQGSFVEIIGEPGVSVLEDLALNADGGEVLIEGFTITRMQHFDDSSPSSGDDEVATSLVNVRAGGSMTIRDCVFEEISFDDKRPALEMMSAPFAVSDSGALSLERCSFVELGSFGSCQFTSSSCTDFPSPVVWVQDGTVELVDCLLDPIEPDRLGVPCFLIAERSDVRVEGGRLAPVGRWPTQFLWEGTWYINAHVFSIDSAVTISNTEFSNPFPEEPGYSGATTFGQLDTLEIDACSGMATVFGVDSGQSTTTIRDSSLAFISCAGQIDIENCQIGGMAFGGSGSVRDTAFRVGREPVFFPDFYPLRGSLLRASEVEYRRCSFQVLDGGAPAVSLAVETSGITFVEAPAPTFVDCTFDDNDGGPNGGLFITYGDANPTFINCSFRACGASESGAVAYAAGASSPSFTNCLFVGNTITGAGPGGVLATDTVNPTGARIDLLNCTVWGNNVPGDALVGNVFAINSIVQGLTPGEPNFLGEPDAGPDGWFDHRSTTGVDESANNDYGDLRLGLNSAMVDAGDNTALPQDAFDLDADGDTAELLPLDLAGQPRQFDDPVVADTGIGAAPIVDLGAYERVEVCVADVNNDGSLNLDDIDTFVTGFIGGNLGPSDCDGSGGLSIDDIDCYVAAFLAGCG